MEILNLDHVLMPNNALEKELDRMAWLIRELEEDDVDAEAYLMNFG